MAPHKTTRMTDDFVPSAFSDDYVSAHIPDNALRGQARDTGKKRQPDMEAVLRNEISKRILLEEELEACYSILDQFFPDGRYVVPPDGTASNRIPGCNSDGQQEASDSVEQGLTLAEPAENRLEELQVSRSQIQIANQRREKEKASVVEGGASLTAANSVSLSPGISNPTERDISYMKVMPTSLSVPHSEPFSTDNKINGAVTSHFADDETNENCKSPFLTSSGCALDEPNSVKDDCELEQLPSQDFARSSGGTDDATRKMENCDLQILDSRDLIRNVSKLFDDLSRRTKSLQLCLQNSNVGISEKQRDSFTTYLQTTTSFAHKQRASFSLFVQEMYSPEIEYSLPFSQSLAPQLRNVATASSPFAHKKKETFSSKVSNERNETVDTFGEQSSVESDNEELLVQLALLARQIEDMAPSRQGLSASSSLQSFAGVPELSTNESSVDITRSPMMALPADPASGGDLSEMQKRIAALASALEKSERSRAATIEKLVRERDASAERFRRLGESLKRLYSTLRSGDF